MAEPLNDLPLEVAKYLFKYHPDTGVLCWRITGKLATTTGHPTPDRPHQYAVVELGGRSYQAHRLAWFMIYGKWPADTMGHINGDITDNRLCNLRETTRRQNNQGMKKPCSNTSGYKGVYFCHWAKKYRARIQHKGRKISLGNYDDPKKAHEAYCKGARKLFGEFARFE